MSAEGGRGTALRVHELTRQFGRPETTNSPVSASSPVHQKSLPKVLSHIAKTPPQATPDNVKHSADLTGNGMTSNHDDEKIQMIENESPVNSSESESEECQPNPASSVAQIRPTPRQPVQHSKIQSSDYVIGLDQLQEQVRRLALRRGFTLNIMVVGKSRSSSISAIFLKKEMFQIDLLSP